MTIRAVERGAAWAFGQLQRWAPDADTNFYLEGPYAPVPEECTVPDLAVRGSIPVELQGLFAQIGPNPISVPNGHPSLVRG